MADLVQTQCGMLHSIGGEIDFLPGQVVTSCNGEFILAYQDDGKVVLKHVGSQTILWHQPANQASAYTFYREENSELGITAFLPPNTKYSGMSNIATVPSTPGDSNPYTEVALASAFDNSNQNPTAVTSPDTSGSNGALADAISTDGSSMDPTLVLVPGQSTVDHDTTAASGSATFSPEPHKNTARDAMAVSLGKNGENAVGFPTSSSKSSSNLFLNPPSNSYFAKRNEMENKGIVLPDMNGAPDVAAILQLHDSGDVTLEENGKIVWSSETQGTDCKNLFIPEKGRFAMLAKFDQSGDGAAMGELIRQKPCLLKDVYVALAGGHSRKLSAKKEPAGLLSRALPGHTTINEFKFYVTMNPEDPTAARIAIASARLQKTFYYNGQNVSDAPEDGAPERSIIMGEATDFAQFVGYTYGYFTPDSDREAWANWDDSGQGAHVSSRVARLNFVSKAFLPIGTIPVVKFAWHHEFSIKAYGDGTVECRGGQTCREGSMP